VVFGLFSLDDVGRRDSPGTHLTIGRRPPPRRRGAVRYFRLRTTNTALGAKPIRAWDGAAAVSTISAVAFPPGPVGQFCQNKRPQLRGLLGPFTGNVPGRPAQTPNAKGQPGFRKKSEKWLLEMSATVLTNPGNGGLICRGVKGKWSSAP
jgi:hypothetical protein